jgi:putative hemolysin
VLRLLRVRDTQQPPVTDEEISILLAEGARTGVLLKSEHEIVERVFRFADETVGAVMVPRTEMTYLEIDDAPDRMVARIIEEPFRQFVVCRGGLDNPVGVVDSHELLTQCLRGDPLDIAALLRHPLYVPESVPALQVLERFRKLGDHLALIVDEYGGIAGMVALGDILDAIVGDLPEFGEPVQPDIVRRDDGSYLIEGMLPIGDMKDHFRLTELPGERTGAFRTVGGFVVTALGHIPTAAESFTWGGFRFEVADMDGNRVDKVLVVPVHGDDGKT